MKKQRTDNLVLNIFFGITKEGYVLLESINKDFEPIDMPISSIRAILQVRYIGKIEM